MNRDQAEQIVERINAGGDMNELRLIPEEHKEVLANLK